jgi:hypothetical protein
LGVAGSVASGDTEILRVAVIGTVITGECVDVAFGDTETENVSVIDSVGDGVISGVRVRVSMGDTVGTGENVRVGGRWTLSSRTLNRIRNPRQRSVCSRNQMPDPLNPS